MDKIFRMEIGRTLDMKRLKQILPPYVRVAQYDQLKNVKTLKDAMRGHSVLVLLFNIHDKQHRVLNQAGHFFAISVKHKTEVVVFSSTGMTPEKELFLTKSDPELLQRILPKNTLYNNVKFQVTRDSNTCWRWLVIFSHLAQIGLKEFQRLFKNPSITIHDPDILAVIMTYILLI